MDIIINKLQNHVDVIPKLANLLHELIYKTWSPNYSIEEINLWFDEWKNNDIPLAFVALDVDTPIGMCSLQLNDGIRPDLQPWLGDLCVDPAYQNRGVGRRLIDAAMHQAKEQGFEKLFLFALDPKIQYYYKRLGWTIIGTDTYYRNPVTVMQIHI